MEDSQPAINAQRKNGSQSLFRHIKITYHYIRQLISEGWCKLVKINRDDCPNSVNEERKKTYLQIIGSIIFGYTHCRLDLAFAVGMLTRVMHNPSEGHLKQLYGLLHYLNETKNWGLSFYRDISVKYGMDFIFLCYCDSSHADDEASFRSIGGWYFF